MDNYIMINGVKLELTEEQIKNLLPLTTKKTSWGKVNMLDEYCFIDEGGQVCKSSQSILSVHEYRNDVSNYNTIEDTMKRIALEQNLKRNLERYRDINGGDDINWRNTNARKYYIYYDLHLSSWQVGTRTSSRALGEVYFSRNYFAENAILEFKDDLNELHHYYTLMST